MFIPGIGQRRDDLSPGVLSFPVGTHLILYRKLVGGILVVHIAHGAQRLEQLDYEEVDDDDE